MQIRKIHDILKDQIQSNKILVLSKLVHSWTHGSNKMKQLSKNWSCITIDYWNASISDISLTTNLACNSILFCISQQKVDFGF